MKELSATYNSISPAVIGGTKKKKLHVSQTPTLFRRNDKDLILFSAILNRGTQRNEKDLRQLHPSYLI